ncbi:unnamed protein product [Adineta steineri]|uniref:Uncharacterized protein n=1 Tax=Adineta steineri TaxID=433720 RepID=A0A814G7I6_9BILA|nr:unnamed protein product [Adineta steineri]CAF1113273.1 unnamed protein product [Adineta steineri]
MTNTTLYPFSVVSHKTMMIVNINQKFPSLFSHLPDIVNDCEQQIMKTTTDNQMKLTCKEIAHSLRLVADQVDKKYCQDTEFNRNLNYLSIRFIFQSIFCTLWTRTLLPHILVFFKAKPFLY